LYSYEVTVEAVLQSCQNVEHILTKLNGELFFIACYNHLHTGIGELAVMGA